MESSRQEHWSGLPYSSPGGLPDSGIEPRSPTLQADSLPAEPAKGDKRRRLFHVHKLRPALGSQDGVRYCLALLAGGWLLGGKQGLLPAPSRCWAPAHWGLYCLHMSHIPSQRSQGAAAGSPGQGRHRRGHPSTELEPGDPSASPNSAEGPPNSACQNVSASSFPPFLPDAR